MARNAFLDRLKSKREGAQDSQVRFFLQDREFDLGGEVVKSSMVRKALKATAKRMEKRFGSYVHPETGERPEIHLVIPEAGKPEVSVRLVTDSPTLREWLKEKGIAIGEVAKDSSGTGDFAKETAA